MNGSETGEADPVRKASDKPKIHPNNQKNLWADNIARILNEYLNEDEDQEDFKSTVGTYVNKTIPIQFEETESILNLAYTMREKLYLQECKTWKEECKKLQSAVKGFTGKIKESLSMESKNVVKKWMKGTFDDAVFNDDLNAIIEAIYKTHLGSPSGLQVESEVNCLKTLYTLKSTPGQSLDSWHKVITDQLDVCTIHGVDYKEEHVAYIFLNGLDSRFDNLKAELINDHNRKKATYPTELAEAYEIAKERKDAKGTTVRETSTQVLAFLADKYEVSEKPTSNPPQSQQK